MLAVDAIEKRKVLDLGSIYARKNLPGDASLSHAMIVNGSPLPPELGQVANGQEFLVEWVVPISRLEAEYGQQRGASRLMFLLRWSGLDIFELDRETAEIPQGITRATFNERHKAGVDAEMIDDIFNLLEGEPDRSEVVDAMLGVMASSNGDNVACALEALRALARSEPESFSMSQVESIQDRLQTWVGDDIDAGIRESTLDAIRHARQHIN
jgi:hypothetical protein